MAERILAENTQVQSVSYSLPNKHYIPVDMRYAGIDNLTPCVFFLFSCFPFYFVAFLELGVELGVKRVAHNLEALCTLGSHPLADPLVSADIAGPLYRAPLSSSLPVPMHGDLTLRSLWLVFFHHGVFPHWPTGTCLRILLLFPGLVFARPRGLSPVFNG